MINTPPYTLADFFKWAKPNSHLAIHYREDDEHGALEVIEPAGPPNPFGGDWVTVTLDGQILANKFWNLLESKFGYMEEWPKEKQGIKILLKGTKEGRSYLTCHTIYQVMEKVEKLALKIVLSQEKEPATTLREELAVYAVRQVSSEISDMADYYKWAKPGSSKAFIATDSPASFHFVKPIRPADPLAGDSITLSSIINARQFWMSLKQKLNQQLQPKFSFKAKLKAALDGNAYFTRHTIYCVMAEIGQLKWYNSPLYNLSFKCHEAKHLDKDGQTLAEYFKWAKLNSSEVFTYPEENQLFFQLIRPCRPTGYAFDRVSLSNQIFAREFWQQLQLSQSTKEWPKAEVKQLLKVYLDGDAYFTRDTMHRVKQMMLKG